MKIKKGVENNMSNRHRNPSVVSLEKGFSKLNVVLVVSMLAI